MKNELKNWSFVTFGMRENHYNIHTHMHTHTLTLSQMKEDKVLSSECGVNIGVLYNEHGSGLCACLCSSNFLRQSLTTLMEKQLG